MSDLKECPFCGSNNVGIESEPNSINQNVLCINCYAKSSAFIELAKAKESWNSVTPNAKIQELIDKYEKREKDPQRPPYEQEAYAFAAYDLKKLIEGE